MTRRIIPLVLAFVMGFCVALRIAGCTSARPPETAASANRWTETRTSSAPTSVSETVYVPSPGDTAVTAYEAMPACSDYFDFYAYTKLMEANDQVGMREMFAGGKVVLVPKGTGVKVIEVIDLIPPGVKVRFTDGPLVDKAYFIPPGCLGHPSGLHRPDP